MALRKQPYLPLYIQDFLTDENLIECSAAATGVLIRIMCIMHKSEEYGKILLKQKDKQNPITSLNFAYKLAKHLPYPVNEINDCINELVHNNVLKIEGDYLSQKRMVRDNEISELRSISGQKGGIKSANKKKKFANDFAKAKTQANSEYEYEIENEIDKKEGGMGGDFDWTRTKGYFLNADEWMAMFCRSKGIGRETLVSYMTEFLNDMELRNEYKDLKELQRHFTNWFNKSLKIKTKQNDKFDKYRKNERGAQQLLELLRSERETDTN